MPPYVQAGVEPALSFLSPRLAWFWFRCVPRVVTGAMLALALSTVLAHAGNPALVEAVESGQLLLRETGGIEYRPALMQETKVEIDITGMVALVRLEQTFSNSGSDWVEGLYAFPLPDQAALRDMEMVVGKRVIRAEIQERQVAQATYRRARAQGKKASLVEQQRPNLFTNRIANIGPGESVVVRLHYLEVAAYREGVFSLRLPLTFTSRYVPGDPQQPPADATFVVNPSFGWALPTELVPDADLVTPFQWPAGTGTGVPSNPVTISGRIEAGFPMQRVDSVYHDIVLQRENSLYQFTLTAGVEEMDRDFLLSWQPVAGSNPQAAVFTDTVEGEHYALVMVVPPVLDADQRSAIAKAPAREIIFVIDVSGSMGGVPIRQARNSLNWALKQLKPHDQFNVIAFNNSPRALYSRAVPANRHFVSKATEFVRHLSASGGTEMSSALSMALAGKASEELGLVRQVVFITDGAVANETALFRQISQQLADNRLFTVGIGSAPNSWFMRKAAQFGRGSFTFIGRQEEVGQRMQALFAQLATPAASDVDLRWQGTDGVELYPQRIPDLYRGEPLMLLARLGQVDTSGGSVQVSGLLGGSSWQRDLAFNVIGGKNSSPATIAPLWARAQIADLLDQKQTGMDADEIRTQVLKVALKHRLASPYTSFVAVEEKPSRPQSDSLKSNTVPNSAPKGQSPQAYAWPVGATGAESRLMLGTLLLFIALSGYVLRQPETERVTVS